MAWDGRNRRKFSRIFFPCLIKIRGGHDGKDVLLTHTENLSSGGVRVILKKFVGKGTIIDVEIDLMDTGEHLCCKGCVVWSEQRKETEDVKPNFFDIGVEFTDINEVNKKRLNDVINHQVKQGGDL